ncbi:MAG TPA: ECF-type sigma factor, partial [Candidatus Acidoferrum sp.]|nr:ECF-type sigma factor [Candidatus Acidoferrum sp.]
MTEESPAPQDLTLLLAKWRNGDRSALDQMTPLLYEELRRLARHFLASERTDHTLQPTALVHEAYLRLIDQHSVDWRNRAHFMAMAATMMRRILINHAQAHNAAKREG